MKKARAAGFFAVAAASIAGILLIPTPLRVQGTLVLRAANPAIVYPEVEGQLVKLHVRDGDPVKKGDPIATLSNLSKMRERLTLTEQVDINLEKAQVLRSTLQNAEHGLFLQYLANAEALNPLVEKVNEQIAKLSLYAPRDGYALGVPHPETTGQWLKPGDKPICEVADPRKMEAHLILDQSDVDLVRLDRDDGLPKAWIKMNGDSEKTRRSFVAQVARRNRDEVPPELSNLAGGEIATKPDEKSGTAKPLSAVYEVIIPIDNEDLHLQLGQRGFAKIDGGHCTLGWWLWRAITKTFHFSI